jgi:hypothetical protein
MGEGLANKISKGDKVVHGGHALSASRIFWAMLLGA